MVSSSVYEILKLLLGVYSLLLAIFGSIGNVITAAICCRKYLRQTPTFIFIAFGALVDMFFLVTMNLSSFTVAFFGYQFQDTSVAVCKIVATFGFFSIQASAFLLVALSFERFLSVRLLLWRKIYFKTRKAVITCAVITGLFFLLNFHLVFTINFTIPENVTHIDNICGLTPVVLMWMNINTYLYSFIPFGLPIITNALLLYSIHFRQTLSMRSRDNLAKYRSVNILVIARTITFIVCTAPGAVITAYFMATFYFTAEGQFYIYLSSVVAATPAGINLLLQLIFNKEFRKECKTMCQEFPSFRKNNAGNSQAVPRVTKTTSLNQNRRV